MAGAAGQVNWQFNAIRDNPSREYPSKYMGLMKTSTSKELAKSIKATIANVEHSLGIHLIIPNLNPSKGFSCIALAKSKAHPTRSTPRYPTGLRDSVELAASAKSSFELRARGSAKPCKPN